MAKQKGGLCCVLSAKNDQEESPVGACAGWNDVCEFCDKRLCEWSDATGEDVDITKVKQQPGIVVIGLKSKGSIEVVDMDIDRSDAQKLAFRIIDKIKDKVSDKKSKLTKSQVVFRWACFPNPERNRDFVLLCAHWYNVGVMPRFCSSWPGPEILQNTQLVYFSDELQKYCYPKKDPFWRKPKSMPSKLVEVVEGCSWSAGKCEICDESFSSWKKLDTVLAGDKAPEDCGIFMAAIRYGSNEREVVDIYFDRNRISLNIRKYLKDSQRYFRGVLSNKKFQNRNPVVEVRWAVFKNPESENCCYLYAHWLNSGFTPMMTWKLPGEKILEKNKHFVRRLSDKKWCYEIEAFKQLRKSKVKDKRHIHNDIEEDMKDMYIQEDSDTKS